MVKLEEAIIARLEKAGEHFEVLVDPDLAMELKKGAKINMDELLAVDSIFRDAHKGQAASEELTQKVFGTKEPREVAKQIILQGKVQLTTEQRKKMLEQRRKEVIAMIARNAWNPQTNSPHPPQRIENALEEARISIDPTKTASEQMGDIIKEIKKLIPISLEKMRIAVKIPANFAGKASHLLHNYELKQEEWQKDGSLVAVVELPAGVKQDFLNELNHLTHGAIESKIIEH